MNSNFNPLVSIIIPAYNSEKFIEQAIKSVQNQTYSNFEVIVIDDGSTDNTNSVVRSISEQDDRINCYKIEPSHRPSVPRNYGIRKAKGKFIAFLDSDDLWSKDKLQRQLKIFRQNPKIIFVYSMSITFGDVNLFSPFYELLPLPFRAARSRDDLIQIGNTIPLSSVIVKTDKLKTIGGFDEDPQLQVEDYDLWLRLSELGDFIFIPRIDTYYRIHSAQFSADWETRKKRLKYLAKKRGINLPDYKYYRKRNKLLLLFRNKIHFFFYIWAKFMEWLMR